MSKIKILHIITNPCRQSGPQQIVLSLVRKMDSCRFDNYVAIINFSKFTEESLLEKELVPQGRVTSIPWNKHKFILDGARTVSKIIMLKGIHILHCHDNRATLLAFLCSKKKHLPLMRSMHGQLGYSLKFRIANFVDKILLKQFDRIAIGSEAMRDKIPYFLHSKVVTILNGIDLDYANKVVDVKQAKKGFNIDEDVEVICTIGRLAFEKGHTYLLQAAKKVCERFPTAVFLIVGEGPLRNRLENLAKKMGLDENVIFSGFQPSIQEMLAISDIFVQPSVEENLAITTLEAMARGKPVVSTDVGGAHEAVVNGLNGLLVPPSDPEQLTRAIITLLDNPIKMQEMGQAGQSIARDRFSDQILVKNFQKVYESLASAHRYTNE